MNGNPEVQKKKRMTRQRAALAELLRSTRSHPTAAQLFEKMQEKFPSISLGTVYRNLAVLTEQGEARILRNGSGFDRFDGDMSEHSHAVCTRCGKIADVSAALPPESSADAQAGRESGFRILSHRLDFYGICPDCLRAEQSAQQPGSCSRA